jgi:hypothetical protein
MRALAALGVLVNVLAVGCTLGPGCSEECAGNVVCDVYSKAGCPVDIGCGLVDECLCSSPLRGNGDYAALCNFSDAGVRCAAAGDSQQTCSATAGCLWGTSCSGLVACSAFHDVATCEKYPNACHWAKDCG